MPNDELSRWLQPGRKVRQYFNPGNPNNRVEHIRAIVDDDQVVVRWWSKGKQRWVYEVRGRGWYEMLYHKGNLQDAGETDARN